MFKFFLVAFVKTLISKDFKLNDEMKHPWLNILNTLKEYNLTKHYL